MSFLNKLKQVVGVRVVKVELEMPTRVSWDNPKIQGNVILSCESPQKIVRLTLKLEQEYMSWAGEDKETKKYELGRVADHTPIILGAGERKTIPFTLPFQVKMSANQANARKGGLSGAFGKVMGMVDGESVNHNVIAQVDVAGSALDAFAEMPVQID